MTSTGHPPRNIRSKGLVIVAWMSAAASAAGAERVNLQLKWHHQFQFAGYYAAEAKGFYTAENLEVTMVEGGPKKPPVEAVLSGDAQFGVTDSEVLLARMRGKPLVVCAAIFQHSPYVLLSRQDRNIRSPSDLVGAKVMVSGDQGAEQVYAMLSREGIDPRQVNILQHSWSLDDVIDGKVDAISAYATVEPARMRARGVEPFVMRSIDYGVDFYGDTLFTREEEVKKHPRKVAAFVRASLKGWEYALSHPEEITDVILAKQGVRDRGVTREMLLNEAKEMRPFILPDVVEIGHMNEGRWQYIASTFSRLGIAGADARLKGFVYDPKAAESNTLLTMAIRLGIAGLGLAVAVILWNFQIRRRGREHTLLLSGEMRHRKEVEEELRASEQRVNSTFAAAASGITMMAVTGEYLLANPAYCRMTGYTEDELRQRNFLSTSHQEDRPEEEGFVDRLLKGEIDHFTSEKRVFHKDGRMLWVRSSVSLIRPVDGSPSSLIAVTEDITEHKMMEREYLRAQRLESIGTLAGGIAHDLNNVLAPITMSIELLRMKATDDRSEELLGTIAMSAKRAAEMVNQVLSFARGLEGRRVEIQARHLIQDIEKIVRDTFPKNITLQINLDRRLRPFRGDPTQLHQVLLNLCVNARDAMPGGGYLRIGGENVDLDGDSRAMNLDARQGPCVRLWVEDTGSGIPDAIIGKIFEPFFTTKEQGKGTGLGLSTSLAIIKSHGGFINVTSRPDQGSRFAIYLPALLKAAASAEGEVEPEISRGHGELILVVDDETAIREVTKRTLEAFGYAVILAGDGVEAVKIYAEKQNEIALVLTDMMMPVMDGSNTVEVISRINPSVKIIAASGVRKNHVGILEMPSVKRFLAKPFTADTLLSAIGQTLTDRP